MEHFKELKPPAKKVLSAMEQKAGRLASNYLKTRMVEHPFYSRAGE